MECRFDSAAGLGVPFKNPRGALMGCVLSPDRAKIMLNSIVSAISLHTKGVRLYGWGVQERIDTWAYINSMAFADDWCGTFSCAEEVLAAWKLWDAWAMATGSTLGIKGAKKTVLTGVTWVDGVAKALPNLRLRTSVGREVPFIMPWEAYKHLGIWRRADGSDETAWKETRKLFRGVLKNTGVVAGL